VKTRICLFSLYLFSLGMLSCKNNQNYGVVEISDDPEVPIMYPKEITDAYCVGLGESTHGSREFTIVKSRIIRSLVSNSEFDLVVLEAGYQDVRDLDSWVNGKLLHGDLDQCIDKLKYWTFKNSDFIDLMKWLKQRNSQQKHKVRIAGMDMQFIQLSLHEPTSFFRTYYPSETFLSTLIELDTLELSDLGSKMFNATFVDFCRWKEALAESRLFIDSLVNDRDIQREESNNLSFQLKLAQDAMTMYENDVYDSRLFSDSAKLEKIFKELVIPSLTDPEFTDYTSYKSFKRFVRSSSTAQFQSLLRNYVGNNKISVESRENLFIFFKTIQSGRDSLEIRDKSMAENILYIAKQYGSSGVIIWGHNYHIEKESCSELKRSTGYYLNTLTKYKSIGFLTRTGSFTAIDEDTGKLDEFKFLIKSPENVEYKIHNAKLPRSFISKTSNLSMMISGPSTGLIMDVGASYSKATQLSSVKVEITRAFDYVVYLDSTSSAMVLR
jgi:erythromycin esterase-like protein